MATGGRQNSKGRSRNGASKTSKSPVVKKAAAKSASNAKSTANATAAQNGGAAKAANGSAAATGASSDFDLAFLRGLIEAIDNSGIDSVEIDREGTKVRISKTPPAAPVMAAAMHAPMMQASAPVAAAPMAAPSAAAAAPAPAAAPAADAAPKSNYADVKSPMVGTFYRAPAPEAPSYVEIGSHVSKGQTLCILEAMKLMNELESEVDGIVREILVDNADPVEYGQVLFRIEPASR